MALVPCAACKAELSDRAAACPRCGHARVAAPARSTACPDCGAAVPADAPACARCGCPREPAKELVDLAALERPPTPSPDHPAGSALAQLPAINDALPQAQRAMLRADE